MLDNRSVSVDAVSLTEDEVVLSETALPRSRVVLRDFPLITVSRPDEERTLRKFARWVEDFGYRRPFVVSSRYGGDLAVAVKDAAGTARPPAGAGQSWAHALTGVIGEAEADVVVAIGGGRCLDIAKLAASRAGVPFLAVPTQLTHDGICSPVAVVPGEGGIAESLPAVAPIAAFFPMPTLLRSPIRSIRAGVADLLSNPLALRDWELAANTVGEEIHEGAWHLSMESFQLVEPLLDRINLGLAYEPRFLGLLSHALANSGLAMMCAGSSRPASGAEHKISHAIDLMLGGRGLHGEQVAFASIISIALHGLAVGPFVDSLKRLELPYRPEHLRLSEEELVGVLLAAPSTRPGRFTVLEKTRLDEASARSLVRSLWGEW